MPNNNNRRDSTSGDMHSAIPLESPASLVTAAMRCAIKPHAGQCIWLTGLSGAGKSTLANELEWQLNQTGRHTYLLDGDNIRRGLCHDLGMSSQDRRENIRRVGEVAKLMVDAGLIVIAAFISPSQTDRDELKARFNSGEFFEVYVDTPLGVCEQRDVKGLYKKARNGEIKDFTGISAPYDAPTAPDIRVDTSNQAVQNTVSEIYQHLRFEADL